MESVVVIVVLVLGFCFKTLVLSSTFFVIISLVKKNWSLRTFLVTSLICLVVLIPLNMELYFSPDPYISTEYSTGFSKENFYKIEAGFTKSKVEQMIGPGFKDRYSDIPQNGEKTCVLYSSDRDILFTDFAWIATSVCYNESDQVSRIVETSVRD